MCSLYMRENKKIVFVVVKAVLENNGDKLEFN